jgi:putative flippase GtrA
MGSRSLLANLYSFRPANLLRHSIVRFGLTGVLNTAVGLGTIFLAKWLLGMNDTAANLLGYCIGFTVSSVLNARWTFNYSRPVITAVPKYALLIAIAYLVNLGTVHLAIACSINSYISQALGVIPYALITYFGAKYFVFRVRSGTN